MSDPSPLELHAGALRLALRPDVGGCIAGLWHGDLPVLRSCEPQALQSPRASGCFPLVPYSNRIGQRRLRWLGVDHELRPNFEGSPHALHGVGWLRPWTVAAADAGSAELHLHHAAGADWPFDFDARQRFSLDADGLEVRLAVVNRAPVEQPIGLGWHPYFPKRLRSRLHVETRGRWESDATLLPLRRVDCTGIDADVRHLDFDHGFDGWRGAARIRDEALSIALSSSLDRLVVYTPPLREYFCVEPVSHDTDAIHRDDPAAHGLRIVSPGGSTDAWLRLEVGRP